MNALPDSPLPGLTPQAAECLKQLEPRIPAAMRLLHSPAGERMLAEHSAAMRASRGVAPLQDGQDLLDLAVSETARLLSREDATALKKTLENDFCALTANHHGADFHPEFVQGTLIFALSRMKQPTVPVFAVGGVPLNNAGFPRGILLGRGGPGSTKPRRLPVLPLKNHRAMVSVIPPFGADAVHRALQSPAFAELTPVEAATVRVLLRDVFSSSQVLGQSCYRDQATVMNALLWRRLFAPEVTPPRLITLDMQFLCGALAARDRKISTSLFHALALEPACVTALVRELNGARGCWTLPANGETPRGTFLFWALDAEGKPVSMLPSPSGHELLAWERPDLNTALESSALAKGLAERRLLPGLYLFFALTALARGLTCCGGVYQTDYLTVMREGTERALRTCGESAAADHLAACGASPLSTGFLPLRVHPGKPYPVGGYAAGTVDIAAHGGLTADELERLGAMTVQDALTAALAYQYEDLVPEGQRSPDWLESLDSPAGLPLVLPDMPGGTASEFTSRFTC